MEDSLEKHHADSLASHLRRKDFSPSQKFDARIYIEKTSWINQWACVPFQFGVIPLSSKEPIYLIHYKGYY